MPHSHFLKSTGDIGDPQPRTPTMAVCVPILHLDQVCPPYVTHNTTPTPPITTPPESL